MDSIHVKIKLKVNYAPPFDRKSFEMIIGLFTGQQNF